MVKKILRWFGYVPAFEFRLESFKIKHLEKSLGVLIDTNRSITTAAKSLEYRINNTRIESEEKDRKIKAQSAQLKYFHKDRENISKTRRENEELEKRVKVQRENINRLVAANEYNGEEIESLTWWLEKQEDYFKKIRKLERRVALSKMQRRSYRANDRYLKKQLRVAYSKGYEDGKDDGLLEGYIE